MMSGSPVTETDVIIIGGEQPVRAWQETVHAVDYVASC